MKRLALFLAGVMLAVAAVAQSYSEMFDKALADGDVAAQRRAIAAWQQAAPGDADLYVARYNFYVNQAMEPVAVMDADAAELRMEQRGVDGALADSALWVIDEAIALFPDRLDLRFGKVYFLGEIGRWDAFADEIEATLDRSQQIAHRWTFPNMSGDMRTTVTEAVMDYQATMFDAIDNMDQPTAADTAMMLRIRRVAKRTAQLFPGDIMAVNVLATTYTLMGDYEQAVKYLLRAEKIDPTDTVVLRNLADVYGLMGNRRQSEAYNRRLKEVRDR